MLTYPLEGGGVTMGFQKKQPIALANIKYNTNSNHVLSTFFRRALPLFCLLDLIKKIRMCLMRIYAQLKLSLLGITIEEYP